MFALGAENFPFPSEENFRSVPVRRKLSISGNLPLSKFFCLCQNKKRKIEAQKCLKGQFMRIQFNERSHVTRELIQNVLNLWQ